jgi:hypothetical protein
MRMTKRFSGHRQFVFALAAILTMTAAAQTPGFQGLGQMPGAAFAGGTFSTGISGDGSTIMGYGWVCAGGQSKCNSTDTVQAYRWTVAGGYEILGSPGNSAFFGAGAVSYNGLAIAGDTPSETPLMPSAGRPPAA